MERMAPEFMAWRARIDPDDEDDEALAARFLAELPEADAALLAPYGAELVGGLAWEALVEPEGYLRDAALLIASVGLRRRRRPLPGHASGSARTTTRPWPPRPGGRTALPQAALEVAPGTTHLATLLTQWPAILRRLGGSDGLISEGGLRTWAASS